MKRRRNKRWIGWLVFLVLVIIAIIVVIAINNNLSSSEIKEDQNLTTNTISQEEIGPESDAKNAEEDVLQYDGDSPNESKDLTGVISYADVVGEELIIRVNIDQFVAAGSCKLKITKNGANVYSEAADIEESVTTSTCNGFKIPVSKLTSGDLQIEIDLASEGKEGRITGKVRI